MNWQPIDFIVLLLAVVLVIWVLAAAFIAYSQGGFSSDKMKILAGILTAIISVISVYVGSKIK